MQNLFYSERFRVETFWAFEFPYIGSVLSKNNYKWRNGSTKKEAKDWAKKVAEEVKAKGIPYNGWGFIAEVQGYFHDDRRPDLHNLFPLLADALQEGLNINDRDILMVDSGSFTGYSNQHITVKITRRER